MAKSQPAPEPTTKFDMVALYITSENNNVPVTGNSHYIVLERNPQRVTLFHPFTFTKFTLPTPDFHMALMSESSWDREKFAIWLERYATKWAGMHRQAPYKLVREIIATYRGCSMKDIPDFHGTEAD